MTTVPFFFSYKNILTDFKIYLMECFTNFTRKIDKKEKESFFISSILSQMDVIDRICNSFAKDNSTFEDLRQDTLINIWNGLDSFKNNSNLKTWIYRITLNTCVSTYRREKRQEVSNFIPSFDNFSVSKVDYENVQWLKKALEALDPLDHAIMVMWLDDFAYDEISEVIGLNRNTIATRIKRAKEKIKNTITKNNF